MDAAQFIAEVHSTPRDAAATIEKLYGVGFWLFGQERFADAALAFRTLLRAAPDDERPWLALGACHEKISQLRIALELYGAGSAVVPTSVRCQLARARVLSALDRRAEAAEALSQAELRASEAADEELIQLVHTERANGCH